MTAEEKLLNEGYEDIIIFSGDSYDDALIGVSDVDAMEWIDYNTIRSLPYVGDKAPIVMHRLME